MQDNTKNFGAYLDRTLKAIRHHYLRAFKEHQLDITTEQWVLLNQLHQKDGLSQNELANGSFKNAPTVSRIIDLLCKKGLTQRQQSEQDRRTQLVYLTPEGRRLCQLAYPIVQDLRRQGWENLSDEDYHDLLRILNQVFNNFSEASS